MASLQTLVTRFVGHDYSSDKLRKMQGRGPLERIAPVEGPLLQLGHATESSRSIWLSVNKSAADSATAAAAGIDIDPPISPGLELSIGMEKPNEFLMSLDIMVGGAGATVAGAGFPVAQNPTANQAEMLANAIRRTWPATHNILWVWVAAQAPDTGTQQLLVHVQGYGVAV